MQQRQSFTKYATWPESTLFIKISSNIPEIENFLYISKKVNGKFSILGLSDQKCGFFTNKRTPSKTDFVSKNFDRCLQNSKFAINPFTNI